LPLQSKSYVGLEFRDQPFSPTTLSFKADAFHFRSTDSAPFSRLALRRVWGINNKISKGL